MAVVSGFAPIARHVGPGRTGGFPRLPRSEMATVGVLPTSACWQAPRRAKRASLTTTSPVLRD
eukprot:10820795-Lingulodinium_polyedra.AAC.1